MANSTVKFDEKGDGLARYTIFNYQKKLEGAGYDYKVSRELVMKVAQSSGTRVYPERVGYDYKVSHE
jgi:hypothetical protein